MYLPTSPARKEAKQTIEANKYQLHIFRPLRKEANKANKQSKQLKQAKQVPPTYYLTATPSHVQLLLQLQLYSNDSSLAVHTYVCVCIRTCVCGGGWAVWLCHSEKWLADILHTYLKKVHLMYMYFMYFSESSRYLHTYMYSSSSRKADLTHTHTYSLLHHHHHFFSDRLFISSGETKIRSREPRHLAQQTGQGKAGRNMYST